MVTTQIIGTTICYPPTHYHHWCDPYYPWYHYPYGYWCPPPPRIVYVPVPVPTPVAPVVTLPQLPQLQPGQKAEIKIEISVGKPSLNKTRSKRW